MARKPLGKRLSKEEREAKMAIERELEKERTMRERTVEVLASERKSQSLPSSTTSSGDIAQLKAQISEKEAALQKANAHAAQAEKRLSTQVQQLQKEKVELEKKLQWVLLKI